MKLSTGVPIGLIILIFTTTLFSGCTREISTQEFTNTQEVIDIPQNWWNGSVFYQIFVRSFYDSDGDGIGDLQGIIQKLDYLNDGNPNTTTDLGIKGIWLLPIHPSPSYHGYDVTDYYSINPDYGTLDDFKELISETHKRGICIIIDFVMNHTSEEHPWFQQAMDKESSYHDWYIWSDENPGYLGPWGEVVWHRIFSDGYYYGVFYSGMPDLNYRNPQVGEEMRRIAKFWLADVGVDGFRVDGARHLIENGETQANTAETHAWFKDFHEYVRSINTEALIVGEVWDSVFAAAKYVKEDEFDLVFDFELASAIIKGVGSGNAGKITDAITYNFGIYPLGETVPFLTNHDMDRVMSQFGRDEEKTRVAAAIFLTLPGTPFIYYGEEIGMVGTKPDEYIRTPMQWTNSNNSGFTTGTPWIEVKDDYPDKNVELLSQRDSSLLNDYKNLIHLRNSFPGLQYGNVLVVKSNHSSIYSIFHVWNDQLILLVINLDYQKVDEVVLSVDNGLPDGDFILSPIFGSSEDITLTVDDSGGFKEIKITDLEPYETLIFSSE